MECRICDFCCPVLNNAAVQTAFCTEQHELSIFLFYYFLRFGIIQKYGKFFNIKTVPDIPSTIKAQRPIQVKRFRTEAERSVKKNFGSSICFAETLNSGFRRNDVMSAKAGSRKNVPQKSLKNQFFLHFEDSKLKVRSLSNFQAST